MDETWAGLYVCNNKESKETKRLITKKEREREREREKINRTSMESTLEHRHVTETNLIKFEHFIISSLVLIWGKTKVNGKKTEIIENITFIKKG